MNAPFRFSSTHYSRPSSQMTTVALPEVLSTPSSRQPYEQKTISSPASSFPSIMSFQTLTNWWSPGSTTANCAASVKQSAPNHVRKRKGTSERKHVSKEWQLEKLRSQLEQDRRANCCGHLHVDVCRACVTEEVCEHLLAWLPFTHCTFQDFLHHQPCLLRLASFHGHLRILPWPHILMSNFYHILILASGLQTTEGLTYFDVIKSILYSYV
jgi:hypothetical protein